MRKLVHGHRRELFREDLKTGTIQEAIEEAKDLDA
jgi:hypothetical protein